MRSIVTAVIAAIEAVAVALAGLLVIAVPVLLLWIFTFGLSAEPSSVFGTVSGIWLLGHLVPLAISLDAEAALGFGLPPEALGFGISLAPLGIACLTAVLAARAGYRFGARGGTGAAGVLGGGIGFGLVAFVAATIAGPLVSKHPLAAFLVPAAVYAGASGAAFLVRAVAAGHPWWRSCVRALIRGLEHLGFHGGSLPSRTAEAFRIAAAALAAYVLVASLGLAAALVLGYADVTELSQRLQLDPLGSVAVFLAQLALLPVALVWSGAWFTGAGFSIGSGTSVTPFESLLGPLPALPLFGAIPPSWGGLGMLAPAVLVLAGVLVGALFARRETLRRASWAAALAVPVLSALLVGGAIAGAAALASGSIGPDRLQMTGADPWTVGGFGALELGAGLLLGTTFARIDYARLRERLPDAVPATAALLGVGGSGTGRADSDGPGADRAGAGRAVPDASSPGRGVPDVGPEHVADGEGIDPSEMPTEDLGSVRRAKSWTGFVGGRRRGRSRTDDAPENDAPADDAPASDAQDREGAGDSAPDAAGAAILSLRGARGAGAHASGPSDDAWGDIVLEEVVEDDDSSAMDDDPVVTRDASGGTHEDRLFDQEDQDESHASGDPDPEADARAAEEAEAERLLRAYSWDSPLEETSDDGSGRSGWRFPRRKR